MYDNQPSNDVAPRAFNAQNVPDEDMIDIRALVTTLWRRKWVIVNITVFFAVLAILILVQLTPRFTANGLMAIESRQSSVVDLEAVMSGMGTDVAAIKTEIDVLQSRRLAAKLVDRLGLVNDPEFNGALVPKGGLLTLINPFSYLPDAWSDAILGSNVETRTPEQIVTATKSKVVDAVLAKLSVSNPARSYSMQLSFESKDAEKAARVVNALADIYLTDQLEVKFEATQRANEWLNGRVSELRDNVRTSEQIAQAFREENQLIQTRVGGSVNEQQLAQLNGQLIDARTDLARAEARQQQVLDTAVVADNLAGSFFVEVLQSQLIQRLKEQESQVLRNRAELGTRYGPKHPRMKNVEAELNDVREKINIETAKVVAAIKGEAQVAAIRVKTLEENLTLLKTESFKVSRAQVQMRELERESEANRLLLETFLTRFKETSSQDGLQQADARIISLADVPTEPSFPKKKLTLILVVFAAASLGVGLVFLLEALDNGYRNFDQIRHDLKLRGLGMIPLVGKNTLKEMRPEQYLQSKPTSSFSEAHRNIHASLMFSGLSGSAPKVLAVTSSVPGEGKSTASHCLAQILGRSGLKVLVVEADLRRPVLKRRLELPDTTASLNAVLEPADDSNQDVKIHQDPVSGVHMLWAERHDDPQSLFNAERFRLFIKQARERYDLVIIDTPPVMAVSDVLVVSKHVDAVMFVVQWEKTPKGIVKSAVQQLAQTGTPVAGAVLTQVNIKRHQGYGYGDQGYYYGTKGGGYYTN